jgi:outer membrane receptor protein involved in Fe transport
MKKTVLLLFFISIHSVFIGQTFNGKVINNNGKPILDVYVLNLSNNNHTHTNGNGAFQIPDVKIGDTLQLSHVSYETKNHIVNTLEGEILITLQEVAISLNEIVVSPGVDMLQLVSDIDININPVNSSQDILRKVPGLFIGQHAGGGKAEQIFLRGFDIDHGTDLTISVDGLPVNMVSHAHGQGYSDLHFVIPETIEKIDFGKGPYYEEVGNFNTAGYVNFKTKKTLENSSIKLEAGQFNSQRLLGMFKVLNNDKEDAYVATEFILTDGPFDSPQNFSRINLFGKYINEINEQNIFSLTASHFSSTWDASGQIPVRVIESGLIGRFGAIDDTEGGNTSRTNLLINYDKIIDENTTIKNSAYFSQYDFELYSNFTFFLENPVDGDQIRQKEVRNIVGLNSDYRKKYKTDNINGVFLAGISLRNDMVDGNELSYTRNRTETLDPVQLGDVNETNLGGYVGTEINYNKFTFVPSVRVDYFDFKYTDNLQTTYSTQTNSEVIVSPKLNVFYNYSKDLQLYFKAGKGFHSNDTRVAVTDSELNTLPAAYGSDLGFIWKPASNMFINIAYWYLFLEQEFVYVGDAGIVEPSGRTRRQGIELSYRYQPTESLYFNLDANYTYARSIDEEDGQDYIPLAPDFTFVSGLNYKSKSGIFSSLNMRYITDRPANEDNSIVADGYTVFDFNVGYNWKNMVFGIQVQNLFDVEWNETQFATESRLFDEPNPVEEIHFTPGTPFFLRASIQYNF